MKINQILSTIRMLAQSQGFYGRLLAEICELRDFDPDGYKEFVEELESQNFQNSIDMILYFES